MFATIALDVSLTVLYLCAVGFILYILRDGV
jgi:hypothetical protein